ncbi:O-antigen ligase family protein [Pontibacter sp. 13R65]|uniref:O-antigen ligase family protein n=1 Tax=Pontibacter sp. 13R65 TaxID=3127458 RepID=UPI00301CFBC3
MKDDVCSTIERSKYFLLLAITTTLPFSTNLNSWLIILFVALTIYGISRNSMNSAGDLQLLVPVLALFALYLYGVFVTEIKWQELKGLEQKLSLLALPGVLFYSPPLSKQRLFYLLLSFTLSCFVVSLLTFREGFGFLFAEHRVWALDDLLLMHRPFLGLYCVASLFILIYLFLNSRGAVLRGLTILLFLFFLVYVYIINAKMAALAFIIAGYCTANLFLWKKQEYAIVSWINIVCVASTIIVYYSSGGVQKFMQTLLYFEHFSYSEYNSMMVDSFNVRFGIWKCCKEVLLSNFIWLTGTGIIESKSLLHQCYIDNSFEHQAEFKFDSHNQYLGIWMSAGIFGLIVYCGVLLYLLWTAYSRQQYLYFSIIMLFSICCITEGMMNSQKGILFFSLFYTLFTFQEKDQTEKKSYMYSTNINL